MPRISALPAGTTPDGTEYGAFVQNGTTVRFAQNQLGDRKSLLIDPMLLDPIYGTSFTTLAGAVAPFPVQNNAIVGRGTWGPGTGTLTTGVSSRVTLALGEPGFSEFAGAQYCGRILWNTAPTNPGGSPGTFSSIQFLNEGASKLAGRSLLQVGAFRSTGAIPIYPQYDDGLGAAAAERLLTATGISIPGDNVWRRYETIWTPDAAAYVPLTSAEDQFTSGYAFACDDFIGKTFPFQLDFLFDLYPLTFGAGDDANLFNDLIPKDSGIRKILGHGMTGRAVSTTQVRFKVRFDPPFIGTPGLFVIPDVSASVLQGNIVAAITATTPTIDESNLVNRFGGTFIIGGWPANSFVSGEEVECFSDFLAGICA